MKTIVDSLASFRTCSLYSFACCCWIACLAAKEGQVSIFHCEEVASHSLGRSDMEGDRSGNAIKNRKRALCPDLLKRKLKHSARTAAQQTMMLLSATVLQIILWGKCTPLLPNAINVCLHLKSQLLSLIKYALTLHCQRCKWCRGTKAWGTLMRRDISSSAVVTKWFMLCDEPLSAYSSSNPDHRGARWEHIHAGRRAHTPRHWHVRFQLQLQARLTYC